jgi:hypothetical protein
VDGSEEMAAVAEQDVEGMEQEGNVLGHGAAGAILWRIARRGWPGCVRLSVMITYMLGYCKVHIRRVRVRLLPTRLGIEIRRRKPRRFQPTAICQEAPPCIYPSGAV